MADIDPCFANCCCNVTSSFAVAKAKVVITAPRAVVGDKSFELKKNIDDVLTVLDEKSETTVDYVLVGMMEGENTNSQRYLHLEKVAYR